MRNILFFLLFSIVCGFAIAQEKLLRKQHHPEKSRGTIMEFLQEINRNSGIVLEYSSGSFESNKIVQLSGNEKNIGSVLQAVLSGQKVKLVEHNNKIILIPSPEPFSIEDFLPAQYSFYGYIKEYATNEPLISATVYEPATSRGAVSNNQGYFNFFLSEGKHRIEISYGGFQPVSMIINIQGNLRKDIPLMLKKDTLEVVVVESEIPVKDGSVTVAGDKSSFNFLMNEDDPLHYLYLSPGLQNASYSFGGFQVRGGGTDENLFLLDGNPVYNPTHLLGAISVLNPTVLKSMRLYHSDFPARLGGSLSSVLDIYTKQGNMKNWQGEVNAGLLAGSLTLEGPLVKDKAAIMISGRKNIPFSFYKTLQDGITNNFYDAHFRLSAITNSHHKLALNFYTGEDQLRQTGEYIGNLHRWGNRVGSVQWNFLLGRKSFINTSVNFSRYQNLASSQYLFYEKDTDEETDEETEQELSQGTKFISSFSSLKNYNVKSDAEIYVSQKFKLNTGIKLSQTIIKPFEGKITNTEEDDEESFLSFKPLQFEEFSAYTEAEIKFGKKFFVKPGIRANAYRFEDYSTLALQPRFYMAYRISPSYRIFASYGKMNQFLHLVVNPYAGANRDMWVPSTKNLQPEWSEIYNIGFLFNHKKTWSFSMDGYYKRLINVTNYANGKSIFINNTNWEQNIEAGKGRSYGAEIMIKKTGDKFSLQGSYALSWSRRQFASINNGMEFPYKYDHSHAANVGVLYSISKRIDVSGLWSFASGNVYAQDGIVFTDTLQTAPTGDELIDAYQFIYHYSENNQYRAKYYQRYDASVTYHSLKGKKLFSSLKMGVYNINGADNQYVYNLRGSVSSKTIRLRTGTSVFDILPYVSYTLKF